MCLRDSACLVCVGSWVQFPAPHLKKKKNVILGEVSASIPALVDDDEGFGRELPMEKQIWGVVGNHLSHTALALSHFSHVNKSRAFLRWSLRLAEKLQALLSWEQSRIIRIG